LVAISGVQNVAAPLSEPSTHCERNFS